jgi:hypothetical protein
VSWSTYTQGETLELAPGTTPSVQVGANNAGATKWFGDLADLTFLTPSVWYDLSAPGALSPFISGGKPPDPVYWPADGRHCQFTGALGSWHLNGAGDDFTVNGSLTAGTSPVQL